MGEVDGRQRDALVGDVLPDVELGPVRQRKGADALALLDATVIERPQLGSLVLGIPLAEAIAERVDPLLGARALLVAARTADRGVEAVLDHRVEERRRLELVPRRARAALLDDAALLDRRLDARHDQTFAELGHASITELDCLGEIVPRVDVHQGEREATRTERLLGEPQ